MAFCIRSKRKMEYENKDFIPGPGQYFKISSKLVQNNKRKTPPFFISAKRAPFVKSNDIPGPGSYNLDIKNKTFLSQQPNSQMQSTSATNIINDNTFNEVITNFYTSEKNNTNISNIWNYSNISKYNNFSTKNKSYFSKDKAIQNSKLYKITETFFNNKANNNFIGTSIGFLSQTTRFNDNKNDESNNLGPGSYYESILSANNPIEKKIKAKIKTGKIFGKSGSSSRVVSIPSKTMNGYIFKKDFSGNNSFNKNSENNNDNLSLSSTTSKNQKNKNNTVNKITVINLKNSSKSNDNKDLIKEENNFSDDKYQLLLNEKKFGNTTTATSEFIGPGTYDVSIIEKRNKCINWSKGFNTEKIEKKNNIIEKVKLFEEEMKKNSEEIPLKRKTYNKIQKLRQNKNKILLLYSLRKIKNNILQNKLPDSTRSSFIPDKTEIPGPGYYDKEITPISSEQKISKNNSDQNITNKLISKTPKLNYIKYQFNKNKNKNKLEAGFGSNIEREINKSKSLEELSPFSYFKEKNKYDPGKKNTLYKNIILGKTDLSRTLYKNFDFYSPNNNDEINYETNLINNISTKKDKSNMSAETEKYLFKNFDNYDLFTKMNNMPLIELERFNKLNDDNPGPGNYDLSHKFIIPTFSHGNTLQDKSERFKDDIINENPGPGSYQLSKDFDKKISNNKKILFKKTKADLIKEENIKKAIDKNKKGNEVPGVGYYNLDKKNSLVYKVHLKLNQKQCYNSPFLISSSRFKRQKNLNQISSADYDPYKFENVQKNNQFMVFNKANRFNKEKNLNIGPGSYDLNNEWNKRSYNKLFYSNNEEM